MLALHACDALTRVKALQAGLERPLPLMVIGERDDFDIQLAAVRAGAEGFFTRPLDLTRLESRLARSLERQQGEPYRVLIVDDDADLTLRYSLVLRGARMEVQALDEPVRLFETLHAFNPEVVLLDLNMPGCSGLELAQMIRLHDDWLRIPIIYLSVETDASRQMEALVKAGDDFITKPISDSALVSAVFSHAQRARALSAALTRDGLTGLLTHASIKEQLLVEVDRARRSGRPACVVMLDIDRFKQVNDSHGHAAGDSVIRALANLLRQRLRRVDSLGRYGGEEFLAVLPDCSATQALRIFDHIRERFAELTFRRRRRLVPGDAQRRHLRNQPGAGRRHPAGTGRPGALRGQARRAQPGVRGGLAEGWRGCVGRYRAVPVAPAPFRRRCTLWCRLARRQSLFLQGASKLQATPGLSLLPPGEGGPQGRMREGGLDAQPGTPWERLSRRRTSPAAVAARARNPQGCGECRKPVGNGRGLPQNPLGTACFCGRPALGGDAGSDLSRERVG